MNIKLDELKSLARRTVPCLDLLVDEDRGHLDPSKKRKVEQAYDDLELHIKLLQEILKYRPLPF